MVPSKANEDFLIANAHAKINLHLEVLGIRSDGFHELAMVMQSINLSDQLKMIKRADNNINLKSNNKVISKGHNQSQRLNDATAHAEMIAITSAQNKIGSKYLSNCELFVTLEPCMMCSGAIYLSKLSKVTYALDDKEKDAFEAKLLKENKRQKIQVQRFKGLGEMNPEELWSTTLDPETRNLLQVQYSKDLKKDQSLIHTLMGNDVALRKDFIVSNAINVRDLDI